MAKGMRTINDYYNNMPAAAETLRWVGLVPGCVADYFFGFKNKLTAVAVASLKALAGVTRTAVIGDRRFCSMVEYETTAMPRVTTWSEIAGVSPASVADRGGARSRDR